MPELICKNCGHTRSKHINNRVCRFPIVASEHGRIVTCPCVRFDIDTEATPSQRPGPENNDEFGDPAVAEVFALLGRLRLGHYDRFIEAILTAAHNRKRTLRGAWGFRENR